VADVWRRDGPADRERFGADLRPSHRRARDASIRGRTAALGGQLWPGERCGQAHDVYHSCRHRSGPTGHHQDTAAGLEERRQERLPGPSCPVVLTLPQALRALVRRNQQDRDDLVLRAAAPSLLKRAADPHDVGGLSGGLGVLHPWTRALVYPPPVHGLVPAGGLSADRTEWRPARQPSLVPVQARSKLFRGVFLALVCQERPDLPLPEAVWTNGWVVYGKPTGQGPEKGRNSLGRDCPPHRPDQ
jgi:Putative transposase/Transposase zinc-binding domain